MTSAEYERRDKKILLSFASGRSTKELAADFELSRVRICHILNKQGVRDCKERVCITDIMGRSNMKVIEMIELLRNCNEDAYVMIESSGTGTLVDVKRLHIRQIRIDRDVVPPNPLRGRHREKKKGGHKAILLSRYITWARNRIEVGSAVNYHAVIGRDVTSTGHIVLSLDHAPNNFGRDVAWITNKVGCVAVDALSLAGAG